MNLVARRLGRDRVYTGRPPRCCVGSAMRRSPVPAARWALVGMTLLAGFASADTARAATVLLGVTRSEGTSRYELGYVSVDIVYTATAAETSTASMSLVGHKFTVVDTTAKLHAQGGCHQVDPHTVECREPSDATERTAFATLGGGDNAFSIDRVDQDSPMSAVITGGPGNDRIDASGVAGTVWATGGAGNDTLIGGAGDDFLTPGPGDNTIDGGAGTNTIDFRDAAGPVHASLKDGSATAPNERDTIRHIQNILGSPYDDVLIGDNGPNDIRGAEGNDVLVGLGGNDELDGYGYHAGTGKRRYEHNVLFGGTGDDHLRASCGADTLVPGPGNNTLDLLSSGDCLRNKRHVGRRRTRVFCDSSGDRLNDPNAFVLLVGCRRFVSPGWADDMTAKVPPSRLAKHWAASYFVPCSYDVRPCNARLSLKAVPRRGRPVTLGSSSLHLPRGGNLRVRARLTAGGRAYLRRHRHAFVRVSLVGSIWGLPYWQDYLVALWPVPRPVAP